MNNKGVYRQRGSSNRMLGGGATRRRGGSMAMGGGRSNMQASPELLNFKGPKGDRRNSVSLPAARNVKAYFTIVITGNGSLAANSTFYLFDANGLVSAINGYTQSVNATITGTTGTTAFYTAQVKQSAVEPLSIVGLNYKSSTSTQKTMQVVKGDYDGSQEVVDTLIPFSAQRNTQYQTNLLTFDVNWLIDGDTALKVLVDTSETVTLGFAIGGAINRVS